jgi:predicted transcriptional regulator
MSFSKCLDIVNSLSQEDQDSVLTKLDQYQAMGMAPARAQVAAVTDVLEELKAEQADFVKLVEEQHPDEEDVAVYIKNSARDEASIGINVNQDGDNRYADRLVDGEKTMETRNSDSLRPYVGRRIAIVRTGSGKSKAIGELTLGEPIVVSTANAFAKYRKQTLVPKGSRFDLVAGGVKYLYPVSNPVRYADEKDVGLGIVSRKVVPGASEDGRVSLSTREEIMAGADAIKAMDEDTRDNLEPAKAPGGWQAFVLYEARKLLPKPSDKLKKLNDRNTFIGHQDQDYFANVDGTYYGINKWEDPDATGYEKEGKEPFVFVFKDLANPKWNDVNTMESGVPELMAAIRASQLRRSERDQTQTPEFAAWFKDSKVVDAQGKPRVMVHASPSADIKAFRKSKEGLWFSSVNDTSDADIVASYNTGKGYIENPNPDVYPDVAVGSTFYPVYISIKSPAPEDHPGAISGYPEVSKLRRAGYDGVIYSDGTVVAFDPSQIKSAIGNNGNFDGGDGNISHSAREIEDEKKGTFYDDLRQRIDGTPDGADLYTDQQLVSALEGRKQKPGEFRPERDGDIATERSGDESAGGAGTRAVQVQRLRVGELVLRGRGRHTDAHSIVRWVGKPRNLGAYFTFSGGVRDKLGERKFMWAVIPARYVGAAPTHDELFGAYLEGKYISSTEIGINNKGQAEVGIRGVKPGSVAEDDFRKDLTHTGQFDGDGNEYLRFEAGTATSFAWLRETARRFAMANDGSLPDIVFVRETGAKPSNEVQMITGEDAELRYSMRSGTSTWDMFDGTKFDDITYKMQDKHIDTKRVIESIKKYVGSVANDINVYLQEELFHGRSAKRTSDFAHDELEPMMKAIAQAGYKIADVEEYLQARHAPEANRVIAQRNPNEPGLQDGGSGMTNAAAATYMASLPAADLAKMRAIAARVDAILAKTRQTYVDYGLESAATVTSWTSMFQYYIPLHREDKEGRMGIGQGFSVKGKETRGRTGSKRKVVDILANIAMERERLIVRGEKNRVTNALVGLAIANPNPEFWSVGAPPSERVYDPKTNTVVDRVDPMYKTRDNVIVAKVKDASGNVKEVGVVFNEDDVRAMRMAQALKNLDAAHLEGVLGVSAKITRYFSSVNTQYNPVFGVVNLIRDVQHAMITLDRTPLAKKKTRIARDTISALAGIYSDMRAVRQGRHPTSQWAQLFEDFQKEGGQTGFRNMFATSKDRADELETVLNPDAWLEGKWSKIFTANGTLKVPLSQAKKGAAVLFNWLSDYNESMENGVRLAAYKSGLDMGMSKQDAASLAKNLTVNFNRKGQVGLQAGAMYAFFNAAVQGTANIGQTVLKMEGGDVKTMRLSSTGKKVVYGGLLIGTMQAMMLAAAGFGDDDPPTFVRDKSLIIPTGGKGYVSIPMPLGFNVLPAMGRHLTEFAMSGFKNPTKRAFELMGLFADSFNPIGNAGLSMQTIAPTALDPFVALRENKDYAGRPIARVSSNPAIPGFTQFKDSATVIGKFVAEAINGITGGNAYVAGALSPTPDQVDYLLGQVTGGVGRELSKVEQTALSLARGEDSPIYKIPLAGRFYGNAASQASQSGQFYANVNHLNELETEIKGMQKDKKFAEAREVMRENPDAYMMAQANVAERQVQRLRKEKRELVEGGASREVVKAKEVQITAVMTRMNQTMERLREKQAAN